MLHAHSSFRPLGFLASGLVGLALWPAAAQAQLTPDEVRTQIGWFDLEERLGTGAVPTGAGVSILQCEAPEAANEWKSVSFGASAQDWVPPGIWTAINLESSTFQKEQTSE